MIRENIIYRKLSALGELVMVLVKAWPLWIMSLCALVPIVDPLLRTEDVIMKIGVFYQISGLITVASGVASKLQFAERAIQNQVGRWLIEMLRATSPSTSLSR